MLFPEMMPQYLGQVLRFANSSLQEKPVVILTLITQLFRVLEHLSTVRNQLAPVLIRFCASLYNNPNVSNVITVREHLNTQFSYFLKQEVRVPLLIFLEPFLKSSSDFCF